MAKIPQNQIPVPKDFKEFDRQLKLQLQVADQLFLAQVSTKSKEMGPGYQFSEQEISRMLGFAYNTAANLDEKQSEALISKLNQALAVFHTPNDNKQELIAQQTNDLTKIMRNLPTPKKTKWDDRFDLAADPKQDQTNKRIAADATAGKFNDGADLTSYKDFKANAENKLRNRLAAKLGFAPPKPRPY